MAAFTPHTHTHTSAHFSECKVGHKIRLDVDIKTPIAFARNHILSFITPANSLLYRLKHALRLEYLRLNCPITCQAGTEGSRHTPLPIPNLGTRKGWAVSATPWLLFPPRKETQSSLYRRLGGLRNGLDGSGKSRPPPRVRDS